MRKCFTCKYILNLRAAISLLERMHAHAGKSHIAWWCCPPICKRCACKHTRTHTDAHTRQCSRARTYGRSHHGEEAAKKALARSTRYLCVRLCMCVLELSVPFLKITPPSSPRGSHFIPFALLPFPLSAVISCVSRLWLPDQAADGSGRRSLGACLGGGSRPHSYMRCLRSLHLCSAW